MPAKPSIPREKHYTILPKYYNSQEFREYTTHHSYIFLYPSKMYIDVVNPERISPEGGVNHAAIAVPVFNWEDPDDNDARLGCKLSDHLYECLGRDRKDACKKLVRVIVTFLVYCMN